MLSNASKYKLPSKEQSFVYSFPRIHPFGSTAKRYAPSEPAALLDIGPSLHLRRMLRQVSRTEQASSLRGSQDRDGLPGDLPLLFPASARANAQSCEHTLEWPGARCVRPACRGRKRRNYRRGRNAHQQHRAARTLSLRKRCSRSVRTHRPCAEASSHTCALHSTSRTRSRADPLTAEHTGTHHNSRRRCVGCARHLRRRTTLRPDRQRAATEWSRLQHPPSARRRNHDGRERRDQLHPAVRHQWPARGRSHLRHGRRRHQRSRDGRSSLHQLQRRRDRGHPLQLRLDACRDWPWCVGLHQHHHALWQGRLPRILLRIHSQLSIRCAQLLRPSIHRRARPHSSLPSQ